jgi:hypothetical protein
MMDLSKQRDGHKTSRWYGPFAASLPEALTPILDKYTHALELEVGGDVAYLFHPPNGSNDRPMESAAWTGWVKRLFKRHHGEEIAPKTLRSVFITWLRDSTSAPEILKSAAHAMKHSEQRQASSDYDQETAWHLASGTVLRCCPARPLPVPAHDAGQRSLPAPCCPHLRAQPLTAADERLQLNA